MRTAFVLGLMLMGLFGCARVQSVSQSDAVGLAVQSGLSEPGYDANLHAIISPPVGWEMNLDQTDKTSSHRNFVSPTDRTSFGAIYFKMPFPVGHELALKFGFVPNMRKAEGVAELIEQAWDDQAKGLRFIVQGSRFEIRGIMFVRGTVGWVSYAGTRVGETIDPAELRLAEHAREALRFERIE